MDEVLNTSTPKRMRSSSSATPPCSPPECFTPTSKDYVPDSGNCLSQNFFPENSDEQISSPIHMPPSNNGSFKTASSLEKMSPVKISLSKEASPLRKTINQDQTFSPPQSIENSSPKSSRSLSLVNIKHVKQVINDTSKVSTKEEVTKHKSQKQKKKKVKKDKNNKANNDVEDNGKELKKKVKKHRKKGKNDKARGSDSEYDSDKFKGETNIQDMSIWYKTVEGKKVNEISLY